MKLTQRNYRPEDEPRVRRFLAEVFLLNGRHEFSWQPYRWDYFQWHVNANIFHQDLTQVVRLWETPQGELAAFVVPEGPGDSTLQVHPAFLSPDLDEEMIAAIEEWHAQTQADGSRRVTIWCPADYPDREAILARRGYTRTDGPEHQRRRPLTLPVKDAPTPAGYSLRAMQAADIPARSWCSWKAFHPNAPDEDYQGYDWYANVMRAPLYNPDLDLIAIAPTGEVASFCTLWYDPVTCTAAFEPVGTHPAHQKRGVGKALMTEGLRRAYALGATQLHIGSYSPGAHALYASVGFTEFDLSYAWEKKFE